MQSSRRKNCNNVRDDRKLAQALRLGDSPSCIIRSVRHRQSPARPRICSLPGFTVAAGPVVVNSRGVDV